MKISRKYLCFIVLSFFFVLSVLGASEKKPINIIYMIGDGMGVTHVTAARFEKGPLNLERFKILGLHMTSSEDASVTDSGAAGTALATGFRTNNYTVGLCPKEKPLKNLMEYAREKGKATGLVVTSVLPHATPAAFSAHVTNRYNYDDITLQQINAGFDVLIGGGLSNYYPKSFTGSRRKDEIHALNLLRTSMTVVFNFEHLRIVNSDKFAAILAEGHLPLASDRNYSLDQLVDKAINSLSRRLNGFVLMVEGSQIDIESHKNNTKGIIGETLDFDAAVGAALDFAEKDGNTLVLVTADHETSGIALDKKAFKGKKLVSPHYASNDHTASMVPIFAYGPGAEKFGGIFRIDEVGRMMIDLVK